MTDAAATVRARLLSIAAVTALVGTRVYTMHLPQSPVLPAVLVERVGDVRYEHLRGGERLQMTRVQVTSVANDRATAVAVEAAVDGDNAGSGLAHWRGTVGSPSIEVRWCQPQDVREDYVAGELRQYRVSRDYRVFHR